MRNKKWIVAGGLLVIFALLMLYFLPRSFSDFVSNVKDFTGVSGHSSVLNIKDGKILSETYSFQIEEESQKMESLVKILESSKYYNDPWHIFRSLVNSVSTGKGGTHLTVVLQSPYRAVIINFYGEDYLEISESQKSRALVLTNREIVHQLYDFIKENSKDKK